MINKSLPTYKYSFFAAANGYSGFRSYFDKIFIPQDFNAIYILKGGPGTGKSSFMKRILTEFDPFMEESEAIHCSSDPASLDGIIISKGGVRIAVIDGTAPHAKDPAFPGAIDKIINLGENWDDEILAKQREKIISLSNTKSQAYRRAYEYLHIAGEITKMARKSLAECCMHDMSATINSVLSEAKKESHRKKIRLVTAYCKDGFVMLDTIKRIAGKAYSISGMYGSEYLFMRRLTETLDLIGTNYTLFPSALDGNDTDAVFIPMLDLAVVTEGFCGISREDTIDTSAFIDQDKLAGEKSFLESLWSEREEMLWGAADQFRSACDAHLALERIYTAAMDFSKNDDVYLRCLSDIKKRLNL